MRLAKSTAFMANPALHESGNVTLYSFLLPMAMSRLGVGVKPLERVGQYRSCLYNSSTLVGVSSGTLWRCNVASPLLNFKTKRSLRCSTLDKS